MPIECFCQNPACQKVFFCKQSRIDRGAAKHCSYACAQAMRVRIPLTLRFWPKIQPCPHGDFCPFCCWEWTAGKHSFGYGVFPMEKDGEWISHLAHRIAWELINQRPVPDGLDILHHCDNPPCCSIWHIYAGTHQQNMDDKDRRGRVPRGELVSVLTTADVVEIRESYRNGSTLRELAQKFPVGDTAILHIVTGRDWGHVPGALSEKERRDIGYRHRRMVSRTRRSTVLTETQVRDIRRLAEQGTTPLILAAQFGVSRTRIYQIVQRKTWKDVY